MKLFISWSGEFSRKVAERLSVWIPTIIQSVDVFYSPDDIAKGENWGNRLSEELEQSNFGIVCLTPENVSAPWIHFEAGALSKAANSRLSAIMLGINPSDVKGPLARFQNTAFERDDFFRLFQSINASSDKPLKPEILTNAFSNAWEKLMSDIDAIIKDYSPRVSIPEKHEKANSDSDSDALQEILRIVRTLGNNLNTPSRIISVPPIDETEEKLMEMNQKDSKRKVAFISCPRTSADDVFSLILKYCRELPDMEACKGALSNAGKCAVLVDSDQIPAFAAELQNYSATLRF